MQTILIISATSDIAKSLAKIYAKQGKTLLLHGRSSESLNKLKAELDAISSDTSKNIILPLFDLLDDSEWPTKSRNEMYKQWLSEVCTKYSPDTMVIASGGLSGSDSMTLELNAISPMKFCELFIEYAKPLKRKSSIVFMSSVAGDINEYIPGTYSSSKYIMNNYIQSLQKSLNPRHIKIHNLRIGMVLTKLTKDSNFFKGISLGNTGRMISFAVGVGPDEVAKSINNSILQGKEDFYAPEFWMYPMYLLRLCPIFSIVSFLISITYFVSRKSIILKTLAIVVTIPTLILIAMLVAKCFYVL